MVVDILFGALLVVYALALVVLPASSWVSARVMYPRRIRGLTREPDFTVNVIVPCYGRSEALAENLLAIVRQDYLRYKVTFVTDTADDPAVADIRTAIAEAPHVRHIVAGYSETCGQKVHVQLTAIAADPVSDIFVICDSDMRPGRDWLRELVRPFAEPGVLVTGSSRWIVPPHPGLGGMIYTGLTSYYPMILANPLNSFVWGGCFTMSRKAFQELGIKDLWAHMECDDLSLSRRLAERGHRPVFVPTAVSPSHESYESVRSLVRWFIRQSLTARLHAFPSWVLLVAAETAICAGFLASVGLLAAQAAAGAVDHRSLFAPLLFALLTLNVLFVKGPYWRRKDMPLALWLLAPVPAHLVLCFTVWRSVFVKKMSWGAVQYEFNPDGSIARLTRVQKAPRPPGSPS